MEANSLAPAHRGYQYQDLVSALALVDVILGHITTPTIDRKLFGGDLFDDLTLVTAAGERHRMQIKHSSGEPQPLGIRNFTTAVRNIRIDDLLLGVLNDRRNFPEHKDRTTYRLVFNDLAPTDPVLQELLPVFEPDSTTGLNLFTSPRRFDAGALLALRGSPLDTGSFATALSTLHDLPDGDLVWACSRLVVETEAPLFSGDLSRPGPAEELLLMRARDQIGAGAFPNHNRAPIDFAAGLILAAQSARTGKGDVDPASLSRRIQLRTDFGAVAVGSPVVQQLQVDRVSVVASIVDRVRDAASTGRPVLITGPPGQGKSWASDQLLVALRHEHWLVAAHYCYLGEADQQRDDRVLLEAILGSLIGRIAEADASLVSENLPRYAVDRSSLEQALHKAVEKFPSGVALVIDGLDHISRVLRHGAATDASRVVCEALAELELPMGVTLVIASQPGDHLTPFGDADMVALPGMTRAELGELAQRLLVESDVVSDMDFVDAIDRRSSGNALYATYLCREALRRDHQSFPSGADAVLALPDFDGTLANYYDYLYDSVESEAWLVAEWLAVAPFALTRAELKQLGHGHRVDSALSVLAPVVRDSAGSGVRFYHESFGRFVRDRLSGHADAVAGLLEGLSNWLASRGIFDDQRAFRWLLPIMAERGLHTDVVNFIDDRFVERALMESFSPRLILGNIARAAESACIIGDWPVAARLVQVANSAHMFAFERFELMVDFTDVQCTFLEPQKLASRLLDDDRLTMTGREGLLRCAAVDALGAVAPWAEYIEAYERERGGDNVYRGGEDERQVKLAILRGRLRLAAADRSPDSFDWNRLAQMADSIGSDPHQVFDVVDGALGTEYVIRLAEHSADGAELLLILAERDPQYRDAALAKLVDSGWTGGLTHRVLELGLDPNRMHASRDELRASLLEATRLVTKGPSSAREGQLDEWLDLCAVAARVDPLGLAAAEAIIQGPGWYRCWLGFVFGLVRAEIAPADQSAQLAFDALTRLEEETNPFVGSPRACDLYFGHDSISRTIERALRLLDADRWSAALELLGRVSEATTTILRGTSTGPVHADELARIVTKVSRVGARGSVRDHLLDQADNAVPDVHYAEVAGHRLRLARLEIEGGDIDSARVHWEVAVALLAAYGSHKDATIYEFIEALDQLSRLDPVTAQRALAKLQDVTLAIQHHTDGRGTGHVHSDWWKEVASMDPRWLINVALPELYSDVNSTLWALQEAVEQLWLTWRERAHPRVAAASRLAIDAPLLSTDAADLLRYFESGVGDTPEGRSLLRWLIARADERQTRSTYSNAREILDEIEAMASDLNVSAQAIQMPRTFQVQPSRAIREEPDRWGSTEGNGAPSSRVTAYREPLAAGVTGVYDVIRNLPRFGSDQALHTTESLSNSIGYRLAELQAAGRTGDAVQALFAIADALPYSDSPELLANLSDGFTRLEMAELAATASVLTWTRSRQGGGWKAFGGEKNLDRLASAFSQERATAHAVLGRELARVTLASDSLGPTQALILAAGSGALPSPSSPAATAIQCWDVAFGIVDRRAPRLSTSDHSSFPYVATGVLSETREIDEVVAAVALAKLCLPGRESKRRALLAIADILALHPEAILPSLSRSLPACSDPITQLALLDVVIDAATGSSTLLDELRPTLRYLANSNLVSIRTAARSVLEKPPELPLGDPSSELSRAMRVGIQPDTHPLAESMMEEFLSDRLSGAVHLIPEAADVLLFRLGPSAEHGAISRRTNEQLDTLTTRSEPHWPDAVLAGEEEAERELQTLAGSVRAARLLSGEPITNPINWERELADHLKPKSRVSLEIERSRHPRPNLAASPPTDDPAWIPSPASNHSFLRRDDTPVPLDGGEWVCIAYLEEREHEPARRRSAGAGSISMLGLWVDDPPPETVPLLRGDWSWWRPDSPGAPIPAGHYGLVGHFIDRSLALGLGGWKYMLCPSPTLRNLLRLNGSANRFSMVNDEGFEVLRLVSWRAEYELHNLIYPRIKGQAIAVRSDQLAALEERFDSRLRFPAWRMMRPVDPGE